MRWVHCFSCAAVWAALRVCTRRDPSAPDPWLPEAYIAYPNPLNARGCINATEFELVRQSCLFWQESSAARGVVGDVRSEGVPGIRGRLFSPEMPPVAY
eukprot:6888102-Prymnesium_polylepis.1